MKTKDEQTNQPSCLPANSEQNTREDLEKTPRTTDDSRPYPHPEYLQLIQFEGSTCGVIAPEDYEALFKHAEESERENNQLREDLEKYNRQLSSGLCSAHKVPEPLTCSVCNQLAWITNANKERMLQIDELRQQLSDEQSARTEITRKYHDECVKLAQELKDERAKCEASETLIRGIRVCLQCGDADIEQTLLNRMGTRTQEIGEFCKLQDKLTKAEKDKARLDWLEKSQCYCGLMTRFIRADIDAAMKQTT